MPSVLDGGGNGGSSKSGGTSSSGGSSSGSLIGGYGGGGAGGGSGKSIFGGAKQLGAGALLGVLKLLDKPRNALATGLVEGKAAQAGGHSIANQITSTLTGLGHGITGHRQTTGLDVLKAEGMKQQPKGVGGFLLGTGVDVAMDPLTYLTFGTSNAAKTGLKAASEHLGADVAKDVAARGTKRALTAEARATLHAGIAGAEGGSEKAATNVLKALDRGGQGGVKVAGRTVVSSRRLAPLTAPAAAAGRAIRDTKVADALIPRGAVARTLGKDVADELGGASARARAAVSNESGAVRDRIFAAARAAKVTDEELRNVVLPALDVGGNLSTLPPRLRPLGDTLADVAKTSTERQVAAGVLPHVREEYVPRRFTEAGREALNSDPALAEQLTGSAPSAMRGGFEQGGHIHARTLMPDAPIADVERVIGGKLRDAGLLKGPLLENEPLTLTARRAGQGERAIAERNFLDEVSKIKGPDGQPILRRAHPDAVRPLGWTEFAAHPDIPELGTWHAPREVAKEITRVQDVVHNDQALREFQGLLGHLQTLWKGYATVPFVGGGGFHARNMQGNIWNNFLAGVKNPADYLRATKIQAAIAKGGEDALNAADRHIVDLAKKHGVLDEGFFLSELTDPRHQGGKLGRAAAGRKLAAGTLNPLSTDNAIIRSGRKVGSAVENNARLAHFIAKVKELGSAKEAALSVRKYLFDYGDLTPADRQIKKLAAFWTWTRKNTPLQVAEAARQPGKFAALAHGYNEATRNPGAVAEEFISPLPDWAKNEGMVHARIGNNSLAVGADLPPFSAVKALTPTPGNLVNQFGGLLPSAAKLLAETQTQRSLFTGGRVTGSGPDQAASALVPLYGKVKRAPYVAGVKHDPQFLARLIASLTGLSARNLPNGSSG